jgi:hypothetical protein
VRASACVRSFALRGRPICRCPRGSAARRARPNRAPRRRLRHVCTPLGPCAGQAATEQGQVQRQFTRKCRPDAGPEADRAGSGAAARVGGAAHMPTKRAAPRREQQGRAAGRTWAHGSSQPSQHSLPAGRSAELGFATRPDVGRYRRPGAARRGPTPTRPPRARCADPVRPSRPLASACRSRQPP